jgi:hypothetical protein
MTNTTETMIPHRRSWGRIMLMAALVASLLVNAMSVGVWLRFREVRDIFMGETSAVNVLPSDLRQQLREAVTAKSDLLLPLVQDLGEARAAVFAAATASPYDRATTEATMNEFRTRLDALLLAVTPVLLDRLDEIAEN